MANQDDLTREANRLYWETDIPVTALAEQLGVSRGTLYNHTHPLDAGVPCSSCGSALVFRNRSARDSNQAHCESCETEQQVGRDDPTGTKRQRGRMAPNEAEQDDDDSAGAGGFPAAGTIPGPNGPSRPVMWLAVAGGTALLTGTVTALLLRR